MSANLIRIKQNKRILQIVDWAIHAFGSDSFTLETTFPGNYEFRFKQPKHAVLFALKWS